MSTQKGFTLIELMVTILILGFLMATAIPFYQTWQKRAIGTEATVMAKQILDAQIAYYLAHDRFFPENSNSLEIYSDDPPDSENIKEVSKHLNIEIPVAHFLDYIFYAERDSFKLTISSKGEFEIFKDYYLMIYTLSKDGSISSSMVAK